MIPKPSNHLHFFASQLPEHLPSSADYDKDVPSGLRDAGVEGDATEPATGGQVVDDARILRGRVAKHSKQIYVLLVCCCCTVSCLMFEAT